MFFSVHVIGAIQIHYIWYDMIWYDMVWYDIWYQRNLSSQPLGKYWQLNEINTEHKTKENKYYKNKISLMRCNNVQQTCSTETQDRRGQTELHVPWTCSPKETSKQCTTSTHTETVLHQEILLEYWGLPSLSLTIKGSSLQLGGRQASHQPPDDSSPIQHFIQATSSLRWVSEWVAFNVPINTLQIISETNLSSQSLATDNLTRSTQETKHTNNKTTKRKKVALVNSTTDTLE